MLFSRRILLRFGSVSSYPGFPPKIMCPFAIHYCCNMCHPIPYFYRRSTPLLQPKSQKNKRKNMKMWFWDIVKRCTGFIFSCITALTKHSTFRVCILMLLVHVIFRKSTYEKWKKDRLMVSCFLQNCLFEAQKWNLKPRCGNGARLYYVMCLGANI